MQAFNSALKMWPQFKIFPITSDSVSAIYNTVTSTKFTLARHAFKYWNKQPPYLIQKNAFFSRRPTGNNRAWLKEKWKIFLHSRKQVKMKNLVKDGTRYDINDLKLKLLKTTEFKIPASKSKILFKIQCELESTGMYR